jgi:ABC-type taurine transport system substrate-binding protein
MFDNLVQNAMFPAIRELIEATEKGLVNVKIRLTLQLTHPDRITAAIAQSQLDVLSVWEPMLAEIKTQLDVSHEKVRNEPVHRNKQGE